MSLAPEQYEDIKRRLMALLPHAEAIDAELTELVPEKPKGRRRRNSYPQSNLSEAEELFHSLGHLSFSMVGKLVTAIENLEDAAEQAAKEAKERDQKLRADLEQEAEQLEEGG